ncbi:MAG: carbon-nitrogen hydrolase [Phycisphaeraceae bacterium]|nr:carbon-nitrogen hydrolase [Phycisphaeraceae bacterium]
MKLTVATCQYAVTGSIERNLGYVLRQMKSAKAKGADVAHFSETCLPGYAGVEFPSMNGFDWSALDAATRRVVQYAADLRLWVILGSAHRLSGRHKPHNSLYVISDRGRLVDRFDKLYCTGDRSCRSGDLANYSPGSHFSVFRIRGLPCGALICHDMRYDELYREYKRRGVRLMFHSYHNGNTSTAAYRKAKKEVGTLAGLNHAETIHGIIVPPTMQTYAANNDMWISANNTAKAESSWPSFFVRPDGLISGRLQRNRAGVLMTTVDTSISYYDASVHWRNRAMRGIYHSGTLVRDARSTRRKSF